MRSYKIIEFGETLGEVEEPDPVPKGAEVLLRVTASGVCHSDLHIWQGYFDLGGGNRANVQDRGVTPPRTLGHEIFGEVEAVGPEANGVAVGDRRIAFPWIGCGECKVCASGAENLCDAPRTIGVRRDGGYATHVLVPHSRYMVEADGIPEELAAIYACSGITAFSALKKAPPLGDGDTLLLIGAGGVGLQGLAIAQAVTGARIIMGDIDEGKLAHASGAGAAHTVNTGKPGALEEILELSGGGLAAAIDFVGSPETAGLGVGALRRGGTLVIVGLYGGSLTLPIVTLPFRNIAIRGSYVGTQSELRELLALVRDGKVAPVPVARRPLAQASATLDDLKAGRITGRVVLTP